MSISELKTELHQIIDEIDDTRILQAIRTLLDSRAGGLPKEEIERRLQEGEDDIKNGRGTRQEDLINEIKTWRKK